MTRYIFELPMKVRDYECDLQGIVNNANYQHYTEHTRHEFLLSEGISFARLHEQGIDDPHKAFNPVTGIHGNILDRESYYSEVCAYSINPVAGCDDVVSGDRANRGVA